jgi:D-alanine-D-alanine ligase
MRVAVVQGGPSAEAEVSRASGEGVARALGESGYHAERLELDAALAERLRAGLFDVVFPVTHGAVGEDGCLQGLIEVLGLPYVGSGVLASAMAMDKRVARRAFAEAGLPVARGRAFRRGESAAGEAARRAREAVGRRLIVKPAASGSALGVVRLEADAPDADVACAIEATWASGSDALVEHFAKGREVTCGVLDVAREVALGVPGWPAQVSPGTRALPPTEIVTPNDAFYTFQARYQPGRSVHHCPAPLGPVCARVEEIAVAAHVALGCRDLSRVDFVVGDEGAPDAVTLLEVNTLPGFTRTSLYPEAAGVLGLAFPALCDALVRSARMRGVPARSTAMPLPPDP